MAISDFISMDGLFDGAGGIILIVVMALGGLAVTALIVYWIWRAKSYNLKVEFKLPRSIKYADSDKKLSPDDVKGFIDWDWGKGYYDAKTGVVWLKRKGKKKCPMKPFNLARYLQGNNLLTVVQVGANDYIPVIPESYVLYEDEKGNDATLLNLRADTSESKAWKNSFERESKNAFSIMNLLQQYAPMIAIGLVIFLWGIQFVMVYNRLKG